jgi:hypothetical protein
MFFLLRVAFWLTVVLVLLPSGGSKPVDTNAQVGATDAVAAAGAAVSDMSGFCQRQPEACMVGGQAAVAIGQRAQAGARMVYEFLHDHVARGETGSVPEHQQARAVPTHPDSQTTLRPTDLDPAWRGPIGHEESVPLPRPRKHGRHRA